MTVAMEPATATHHSSPKVGGQTRRTRLEGATVGHVAAGAPLLAMSSLRGADGVDDTAVRTLLKLALQKKIEGEEEDSQNLFLL